MKKFNAKLAVVLLLGLSLITSGCSLWPSSKSNYDYVQVKKGDISQKVSVTGQVKPAESVDLAFGLGGKVRSVNVEVGQEVKAGQSLVSIDSSDLSASYQQAKSAADGAQARLNEMKKGARAEDLQLSQTQLSGATTNLDNIKTKATVDLKNVYEAALNAAQRSTTMAKSAMLTLTDIQLNHFLTSSPDRDIDDIANKKSFALVTLLGASGDSGKWTAAMINPLTGGAFGQVQSALNNPTQENIDQAVNQTVMALQKVKNVLDAVPITYDLTATDKTNLSAEKSNLTTELITLSAKQEAIRVQKAANDSLIATAQGAVDNAQSALVLKQAGASVEQIQAQESVLKSAQASASAVAAQIAKTIITAPMDGVITKQDAKVGEIISPTVPVVSLISKTKYQIETYIAEADIAKVKVGDLAKVTLDAYGGSEIFDATLIAIDPAETILNGSAVYKTKLQFSQDNEKIKSGLTANIEIGTQNKTGVLIIPSQTIMTKGLEKFVMIDDGQGSLKQQKVEVGITGQDGQTEIISGLIENDRVVNFGN
ncbi:MAG: efflux RND transporter periplasmic adaptor subunit [Candidatus Buchananbacteria bacterium]